MAGYKALCDAIANGDVMALKRGVVRDGEAARHWKPIMDAAFAGRVDMVKLLLDAGADPNVVAGTPGRHTPLIRVMQRHTTIPRHEGHDAVVALLLKSGADPDQVGGPHGFAPIAYAAMGGSRLFVAALEAASAKVTLHLAAILYDRGALRRFLRAARVADSRDDRNRTPLHYVAMSGLWKVDGIGSAPALECAKMLLAGGAEVDAAETLGESEKEFRATALWRAVGWQGHAALSRLLLEAGADPNPAVFAASFEGRVELLELLHEYSADWNFTLNGRTPLIDLMYYKRPAALAWLIAHGADPNRRDREGRTALHFALMQGVNETAIETLLAAGARRDQRDASGKLPDDYSKPKKKAKPSKKTGALRNR